MGRDVRVRVVKMVEMRTILMEFGVGFGGKLGEFRAGLFFVVEYVMRCWCIATKCLLHPS
jgi:hypothetical protein